MRRASSLLLTALLAALLLAIAGPATAGQPARSILNVDYNLDQAGPGLATENQLDLYLPPSAGTKGERLRPVVVWVHGGAFMKGDKSNRMPNKVKLFNGLGYVVASVNYRLSPDISEGSCCEFDPARVRAPDHIHDVAEAIAWISQHIESHGGDPDRIVLIGHSAGAQLVSLAATSPAWVRGRQVSPRQLLGAVSLDTDTFDVRSEASNSSPLQARMLAWNAFGTPAEEAADPRWERMSPIVYADPSDPPFLFVAQQDRPVRLAANVAMANKLGQDPGETVLGVPYDHEGINTALGSPADQSVETARVSEFVRGVVASAPGAGVKVTRRPAKRVLVRYPRKSGKKAKRKLRRKVDFAFRGTGRAVGLECRIDRGRFARCRSPKGYRLKPGKHTFRVRALYPSGRPGDERKFTFRIVARPRKP